MVWGAFTRDGTLSLAFTSNKMNSTGYQDVLANHLLPYLRSRQNLNLVFQQDNAAIHVSQSTRAWLRSHQVDTMDWPACSPDLNPIENLWGLIVRDIYADSRQYNTVADLKQAILVAWNRLDVQVLQKLVSSMPHRLCEVIAKKGGCTNY